MKVNDSFLPPNCWCVIRKGKWDPMGWRTEDFGEYRKIVLELRFKIRKASPLLISRIKKGEATEKLIKCDSAVLNIFCSLILISKQRWYENRDFFGGGILSDS